MIIQDITRTVSSAQANAASRTGQAAASGGASALPAANALNLSKPADFLSQLARLQASEPEKFRQAVAQNADQLKLAAKAMQMQAVGSMLSGFSAEFNESEDGSSSTDSESQENDPFASLLNPAQTTNSQAESGSLAGLLTLLQPQLKDNPKLQALFNQALSALDGANSTDVSA